MFRRLVLGLLVVSAVACSRTIWVSKQKGDDIDRVRGVPFYVKTLRRVQTTTWETTWLDVSLQVSRVGGTTGRPLSSYVLKKTVYCADRSLTALRNEVNSANTQRGKTASDVESVFNQLQACDANPASPTVVSNVVADEPYVDYSQVYYINGPLPWFGSGKTAFKINADGTLAEGSGEGESKLTDLLTSVIPIKDILTAKILPPAPKTDVAEALKTFKTAGPDEIRTAVDELAPATVLVLTIETKGKRCAWSRAADKCTGECLSDYAKDGNAYPLGCKPLGDEGGKKDDENKVTFSGDITLPKSKE